MPRLFFATAIFSAALISSTPALSQSAAEWATTIRVDEMSDVTQHVAFVEEGYSMAIFACGSNDRQVFKVIVGTIDIEFGRMRDVTWRIDSENPVTTSFLNDSGGSGGAHATGQHALNMARAVARAQNRFVVRSGNETVVFSVQGSSRAIQETLAACGLN